MQNDTYPLPSPLITVSDAWLGGEPCFTGRRVATKTLFDYLKAGDCIADFLEDFPSVSEEHVMAVLELAGQAVLPNTEPAAA
jgi:uncharacterized protein (DUF433 family)